MRGRSTVRRVGYCVTLLLLTTAGCTEPSSPPATVLVEATTSESFQFAPPIKLTTVEGPVRVEAPGYASPCWADVDGDGTKDLLVGQFNGGKIRIFKHLGNLQFAAGQWLQAAEEVAEVPGIW